MTVTELPLVPVGLEPAGTSPEPWYGAAPATTVVLSTDDSGDDDGGDDDGDDDEFDDGDDLGFDDEGLTPADLEDFDEDDFDDDFDDDFEEEPEDDAFDDDVEGGTDAEGNIEIIPPAPRFRAPPPEGKNGMPRRAGDESKNAANGKRATPDDGEDEVEFDE